MPRSVTAADVGRVAAAAVPSCTCWQLRRTRFFLIDDKEPFAEIDLHDAGRLVTLTFSVHCAPAWAAIVTAAFAREVDVLTPERGFIQDHRGHVLYGDAAVAYWAFSKRVAPLVTTRFVPPPN